MNKWVFVLKKYLKGDYPESNQDPRINVPLLYHWATGETNLTQVSNFDVFKIKHLRRAHKGLWNLHSTEQVNKKVSSDYLHFLTEIDELVLLASTHYCAYS